MKITKKFTAVILIGLMLLMPNTVFGGGQTDDTLGFTENELQDGSLVYYFKEVAVTLPADWKGKFFVETKDNYATFYHKDSYDKMMEHYGFDGGRLFSLGYSVNDDFSELPSFQYIGFSEESAYNYFLEFPTDFQAYADEEAVKNEYQQLYEGIEFVKENTYMLEAEAAEISAASAVQEIPSIQMKLGEAADGRNLLTLPTAGDTGEGTTVQGDVIALDELGISVTVSDYLSIVQEDGFVYIYTMETDSIPYVIVGGYEGQMDDFAGAFTEYMKGEYSDLSVVSPAETVTIQGRDFSKIVYSYTISGYAAQDTRLFYGENNATYMFGTKEIPSINYYVPEGILESTAGSFAYLSSDGTYDKHVDSTRSVTGTAQDTINEIEYATDEVLNQTTETSDSSDAGTIGTAETSSGGVGSVGEDTGSPVSDTITFDPASAPYTGTWLTFEDGFQLYLPSEWVYYEITQEQQQQGVLYLAGDAAGGENAPYISVVWASNQTAQSVEDLAEELTQGGFQVDDLLSVNGIECVAYRTAENDCSALMFFHPSYNEYVFCITGKPYEQNVDLISSILSSLSPYSI